MQSVLANGGRGPQLTRNCVLKHGHLVPKILGLNFEPHVARRHKPTSKSYTKLSSQSRSCNPTAAPAPETVKQLYSQYRSNGGTVPPG